MSVRTLSNSLVNIQQVTRTKDSLGTLSSVYANRYTNVPCRIQPMSGQEQAIYNTETTVADHVMFIANPIEFPGIIETDRVIFGDRTFDITLVRNIDIMNNHYEIELRELKRFS